MIIAKRNSKEYPVAPEGLHQAVCVDVIDLGMVKRKWEGESYESPMIRIRWEIEETDPNTSLRYIVDQRYGLSLGKKSKLLPLLESWRGRKFTKEELEGFDVEKLIEA